MNFIRSFLKREASIDPFQIDDDKISELDVDVDIENDNNIISAIDEENENDNNDHKEKLNKKKRLHKTMKLDLRNKIQSLMHDLVNLVKINHKLRSDNYLSEVPWPEHLFHHAHGVKELDEAILKYTEENKFLQSKLDSIVEREERRKKDLELLAKFEAEMSDEEEDPQERRKREIKAKQLREAAELDRQYAERERNANNNDNIDLENDNPNNQFYTIVDTTQYSKDHRQWDEVTETDEILDEESIELPGMVNVGRERMDYQWKKRIVNKYEQKEIRDEIKHVNIVIIGAGLTGLITARELSLIGYRVKILEASKRVGGRILTKTVKQGANLDEESVGMGSIRVGAGDLHTHSQSDMSSHGYNTNPNTNTNQSTTTIGSDHATNSPSIDVDLGGEWFHRVAHLRVVREAERYGLEVETPHFAQRWLYWDRDLMGRIDQESFGENPVASEDDDKDLERVIKLINEDSQLIETGVGYRQEKAVHFDVSLTNYVTRRLQPRPTVAKFIYSRAFALSTGADPEEFSALGFLYIIRYFGCAEEAFFSRLSRIKGGFERLIDCIKEHVERLGVEIILNSPVSNIEVNAVKPEFYENRYRPRYGCMVLNDEVTIITAHGKRYACAGCCMAIPLSNISSMEFSPPLPYDLSSAAPKVNVSRLLKSISMCRHLALDTEKVVRVCDERVSESNTVEFNHPDALDVSNLYADSATLALSVEMDHYAKLTRCSLTPTRQKRSTLKTQLIQHRNRKELEHLPFEASMTVAELGQLLMNADLKTNSTSASNNNNNNNNDNDDNNDNIDSSDVKDEVQQKEDDSMMTTPKKENEKDKQMKSKTMTIGSELEQDSLRLNYLNPHDTTDTSNNDGHCDGVEMQMDMLGNSQENSLIENSLIENSLESISPPLRSSTRRDGLVAFSRIWQFDPFGPGNSPEKRAKFKEEAAKHLKYHHPNIQVESIAAHNFAGDPWYRNSGFALRAGTALLYENACNAAKNSYGPTVPFLFAGADLSTEWTGWMQGALHSAYATVEEIHKRCYQIPPRKFYNQTRRLFRKKGKDWDGEIVKVVYD